MPEATERSDVFAYAARYMDELVARDPIRATVYGVEGFDHLLPSFAPERYEADAAFTAAASRTLASIEPTDAIDRVAKAAMAERLAATAVLQEAGEDARTFGTILSPLMRVRQVFELMRRESAEDRRTIAGRLGAVRGSLESWRPTLDGLARRGELPARRHVLGVAEQAATFAASGAFSGFASTVAADDEAMASAAREADAASGELASFLREAVAPHAADDEACGPERYPAKLRYYNGADLDLDELYAWGWADLQRINARMWELAGSLAPGAVRLAEVAAALDADPSRQVIGTDALISRLEAFTQATIDALDGVHFDIDPRIRRCDARIAPEGSSAAPYYIEPSEDLSRPGTTWFPTLGRDSFAWWRIASTWYHEAVPGHHLQGGTAMVLRDRLSRFQRTEGWTSGYGEGWALYAERLMEELGAFTDRGDELGYLEGQGLRAARIVVDLGLHLGFPAPDDLGELDGLGECSGKPWTPEMAVALLVERAILDPEYAASEVDRYLAIPGQATSYKVGERVWLATRAAAKERLGDAFSLKAFHAHALSLGPMGLDPFQSQLARWDGS